jgi:hypothetical protein
MPPHHELSLEYYPCASRPRIPLTISAMLVMSSLTASRLARFRRYLPILDPSNASIGVACR